MTHPISNDAMIIDPGEVHLVGAQISAIATDMTHIEVPGSVIDLNNQFGRLMDMPQIVMVALGVFQQKYSAAYTDLLERRAAIGDALQDAGTSARELDYQAGQQFDPLLSPTPHTFYTK